MINLPEPHDNEAGIDAHIVNTGVLLHQCTPRFTTSDTETGNL